MYVLLGFYIFIVGVAMLIDWRLGILLISFLITLLIFFAQYVGNATKDFNETISRLSRNLKSVKEDALYRSPMALLLYDEKQIIRWVNPAFQQIYGASNVLGKQIGNLDEQLSHVLQMEEDWQWKTIKLQDRYFKVMIQREFQAIYLLDITEEMNIRLLRNMDKLVLGFLFLDDYAEFVETLDDQQEIKTDAMVIEHLMRWAKKQHIYLKRLDEDKFLLLFNQNGLNDLERDKFQSLDVLKEQLSLKDIPITMSFGIAYAEEEAYEVDELANQAHLNLELALGRGGDQVVVRSRNQKARFYGGKTSSVEKRTTGRTKLIYQALLHSIEQSTNVFIVGHRYPDMDSISSAIGLYKIVHNQHKPVKIIVNDSEWNSDIQQLLEVPQFKNDAKQLFVTLEQAKSQLNEKSLFIMVDHHRPSLSEAGNLVNDYDVVVIDHHRRSEEFPKQSVLTFIEPYASSTSELITEFFIYMRHTSQNLTKIEATALLAGIIVDTNNFSLRTGARTFDAASYLRSHGADTVLIKRLLKEDLETVKRRNQLIERAIYVRDNIVVTQSDNNVILDNITAAQATDELLNLKNVEASFTLYRRSENVVGISARSLGTLNVQSIMEQLGGGGHLSNAATQIQDVTVEEAYEQLQQILVNL